MNTIIKIENKKLICIFAEDMDTVSSIEMLKKLKAIEEEFNAVEFDLNNTIYVSSSFLNLAIIMSKQVGIENFSVINIRKKNVRDVFKITGLDTIFNIKFTEKD